MNNEPERISLTDASIQQVVAICNQVTLKNPKNEISVNMSKGISEYVVANGYVKGRQAAWIARNADFWKLQRPNELADIPGMTKIEDVASSASTAQATRELDILATLSRIEKILNDRL